MSSNSIRVFLKISFTMRHRLMPEITCSTTILELEIARFKSLSPIESVPFRGFFGLVCYDVFRFISLKSTILLKCRIFRKLILLFITDCFVMVRSFICLAQEFDRLFVFVNNDNVIIRVCFLFPAVKVFLHAWVGWSLTLAFGTINNEIV